MIYNHHRPNPIFLHSEIFLNEISKKYCFLGILTKPKACVTNYSVLSYSLLILTPTCKQIVETTDIGFGKDIALYLVRVFMYMHYTRVAVDAYVLQ